MRQLLITILFLFSGILCLAKEATTFEDVKTHRHKNSNDRMLVDKFGVLKFDDAAGRLSSRKRRGRQFEVRYDDVSKVVFETTTRTDAGLKALVLSTIVPAASAVAHAVHVHDR